MRSWRGMATLYLYRPTGFVSIVIPLKNPPVLEHTSGPVKMAQKISLYNRVQAILIFGEGVSMVFFTVHF